MKLVLTNVPPDRAEALARVLVEEGLVACANLLPVRSLYRWKGTVCDEPECTLLLKVPSHALGPLRERLMALHPYELPEFVVLDVDASASLPAYVAWVDSAGTSPS